jgi:inorganic pyrophosphatase
MDLTRISARGPDGMLRVVVESPRGSSVKLKYDPALETFTVSRPLAWGLAYPFDWGFVPGTKAPDGDPLDAMLLWDVSSTPGMVVPCRPIAAVKAEQDGPRGQRVRNDRLLVIPFVDRRNAHLRDTADLSERQRQELEAFFLAAVVLEHKNLRLLGWASSSEAEGIAQSMIVKP